MKSRPDTRRRAIVETSWKCDYRDDTASTTVVAETDITRSAAL